MILETLIIYSSVVSLSSAVTTIVLTDSPSGTSFSSIPVTLALASSVITVKYSVETEPSRTNS